MFYFLLTAILPYEIEEACFTAYALVSSYAVVEWVECSSNYCY